MNVIDRVESAKHALTGSGIGRAVSKATSHEIIGPKRKHVDYITHSLEASNISIPDTADMLFERCNNSSWVVVFKSLVTFHHLMSSANERFMQYVASRSTTWMLQTFIDKGGVQGYDMSHAIRRYAAYLQEKAYCYRQMGYDFCRITRGKDSGVLRNMDGHKLLKALPSVQALLDALIGTEINSNDLTNGVITAAFMLLFKDLIRLFACYNDGIINLLEKFFEMKKLECKTALEIYKRFLARMERVSEFLRAAEDAGIDKGDIPDLTQAPNSLLEALESHYQSLEKGKSVVAPNKPLTLATFNADKSLSINGFSSGPAVSVPSTGGSQGQDDYLLEQKRMLEMFEKKKREENETKQRTQQQSNFVPNPLDPPAPKHHTQHQSPVSSSSLMQTGFPASNTSPTSNNKPSQDLLMLSGNPPANFATTPPFGQQSNMFGVGNNNAFNSPASSMNSNIGMNADFNSVFNNTASPSNTSTSNSTPNLLDDLLEPQKMGGGGSQSTSNNVVVDSRMSGDLNKGLERMAQSLDGLNINPNTMTANTQRGHQWNPQQPTRITGGANFQVRSLAPSTLPPTMGMSMGMQQQQQQPGMMQQGMMGNQQMFNQPYQMQQQQLAMQMQPQFGMQRPPMYGYGMQAGGMQQQGMYQNQNNMGMTGMGYNNMQTRPVMMTNTSNPLMMNNDPFK